MRSNIESWTPEERVLVSLLRGGLAGPELRSCRIASLNGLAVEHKVLYPLAAGIAADTSSDSEWRHWAAASVLSCERDSRLVLRALCRTVSLLESIGVEPFVLKGPSLSFGRPRDAGDADILIPRDSLIVAIAALEGAGYRYRGFERNMFIRKSEYRDWPRLSRWSNQFEFSEPETGTLVELHIAFFESHRVYDEDLSLLLNAQGDFLHSSVIDPESGFRFLSIRDRALLLALHVGLKRSPQSRNFVLRHLFDFKSLLAAGLDVDQLIDQALRFDALHELLLLLSLYRFFVDGRLSDAIGRIESLLPRRVVRLVELQLSCLNDLRSYCAAPIFAYRFFSPFILNGTPRARLRSLAIIPLLFRSPHIIAGEYGLPPRSKLAYAFYALEPVRWLVRFVRKTVRLMAGTR